MRAIVTAILLSVALRPSPATAQPDVVAQAQAVLAAAAAGEFTSIEAQFTPEMTAALPAGRFAMMWTTLQLQAGAYKSCGTTPRVREIADKRMVITPCQFERAVFDVQFAFDSAGKIAGLTFRPAAAAPAPSSPLPSYANPTSYTEAAVTIGSGEWSLPATLAMPVGAGTVPAVILLHGSGPQDRDSAIGANKPFRDLATGLASQGIAVLRYDKRTKVHGAKMGADVTVEEEVIEDALAALESVRAHAAVDAARVYIAGHSLGGQLAPEIARRDGRVAGAVLLAAAARPIAVLMEEQLEYLAGLPENAVAEAQAQLRTAQAQVQRLRSGEMPDSALIMGAPVSYFRDLERRDAVAEAVRLDIPLLVLQGGRDYQVTMADFEIWRKATAQRPATSLESFPSLNHLFVAGTGRATPAEYARPGFVAEEVVTTILRWIEAR